MPRLRELLKKKEKIAQDAPSMQQANLNVPEFTFIRTTTESEEVIELPSDPDDTGISSAKTRKSGDHKQQLGFRKSSNAALTKDPTAVVELNHEDKTNGQLPVKPKSERRLSSRLHFHTKSRSTSADSSHNLPENLPDAPVSVGLPTGSEGGTQDKQVQEQREAQWEKRATLLAQKSPIAEAHQQYEQEHRPATAPSEGRSRSRSPSVSDKRGDDDIQEAIRLHEIGELGLSTAMFARLGRPDGANNALAQVLYGLALRHGWGVPPEPEKAIHYLSLAASNSASVEKAALEAGMTKGGAAKGELVLAIFELANCFRYGWGVKVDKAAARQYYETAANLGDTDAMEEAAWCYMEGFGGPKDKFQAAQYLRLAEVKGRKSVGNSWIWKDKYTPTV